MDKLKSVLKYIKTLDPADQVDKSLNNKAIKDKIKDDNQTQLYSGEDATSTDLKSIGGDYSNFTKKIKARKGQPIDRVTLKDKGNFYKSIKVSSMNGDINFTANFIKAGVDLRTRWGVNLLGLNTKNLNDVTEDIKKDIQERIKRNL